MPQSKRKTLIQKTQSIPPSILKKRNKTVLLKPQQLSNIQQQAQTVDEIIDNLLNKVMEDQQAKQKISNNFVDAIKWQFTTIDHIFMIEGIADENDDTKMVCCEEEPVYEQRVEVQKAHKEKGRHSLDGQSYIQEPSIESYLVRSKQAIIKKYQDQYSMIVGSMYQSKLEQLEQQSRQDLQQQDYIKWLRKAKYPSNSKRNSKAIVTKYTTQRTSNISLHNEMATTRTSRHGSVVMDEQANNKKSLFKRRSMAPSIPHEESITARESMLNEITNKVKCKKQNKKYDKEEKDYSNSQHFDRLNTEGQKLKIKLNNSHHMKKGINLREMIEGPKEKLVLPKIGRQVR